MSASTGPILAAAGIVAVNAVIIQGMPPATQLRTAIGTAIAAGGLTLLEQALPGLAIGLSYLILVTVLFVRPAPGHPAPLETVARWYATGSRQI